MSVQSTQTPRQYTPGIAAQAQDAAVFERSGAGIYLTIEWIAAYIQAALGNGAAITFGSAAPANTVGKQDDVFFNIATGEVLKKGASTWSAQANFALDTEVTAAITAAITAHTGAADPHPTYLTQAEATALYKPLTTDDSVATGLRFASKIAQTGTPANGEVQFNNATLANVTQLLISETGRDGSNITTLLDMLQQTTRIIIQSEQLEGVYAWFDITGAPIGNGTYLTVPVAFVTAPTGVTTVTGLGTAAAELTVNFYAAGGGSGVGSGLKFQYIASLTIAEEDGAFARNGTTFENATQVSFSVIEDQTSFPDAVGILERLTTGTIFEVRKSATAYARYRSTGTPVLDVSGAGDCYNVPVASEAVGPDAIGTTDAVYLTILSDAPATGSGGVTSGQAYVFETGTATASGQVRFAGGILYLHESDRSTPTPVNLTTLWQGLTPGSVVQIIDETTPTNFVNYTLGTWTGNPPKNGTVYELPATVAGVGGAIADSVNVRVSFGLKGAQGTPGAGSTIAVEELDGSPSFAASTLRFPNGSVTQSGPVATVTFASAGREILTANRTYFIRLAGSDANNGLTAGNAFQTFLKARSVANSLDTNGFDVTFNFTETFLLSTTLLTPLLGGGWLILDGNNTGIIDSATSGVGQGLLVLSGASVAGIRLSNFTIRHTNAGIWSTCIRFKGNVVAEYSNLIFGGGAGAGISAHMVLEENATVTATENYSITGSMGAATKHIYARAGAIYVMDTRTVTISNTPLFLDFVESISSATVQIYNTTFSGAVNASTRKYNASLGGSVNQFGSGGTFPIPGGVAGTVNPGANAGYYA